MRDVGLDGQQESIAVADMSQDQGAEVVSLGTTGPRQGALDTRIRPRHAKANPLVYGEEAGPCGAWLSRELTKPGPECWVVAPSCSPQQAGDRVTTDRREARQLARLVRAGDLTPVDVPQVAAEALRDRRRAREERLRDRNAATSRRNAFRLRQDVRSTGQAHGSPAPRRWLAAVVCPTPAQQIVFQAYVRAVTAPTARLQRLEQDLPARVHTWRLAPVVEALQALRGVQFTVAVTTVAELGDLTRVTDPKQLMSYLGLTPAEYSSGPRHSQGGITTTGHSHACRALIERAWAYRDPAKVSRHLQRRLEQLPKPIQDLSWKAQVRLCTRYRPLMARRKHANQVVVAIARALVALMWAIARETILPA